MYGRAARAREASFECGNGTRWRPHVKTPHSREIGRAEYRARSSAVPAVPRQVEVGAEAMDATLAAVSGLLVAAERAGGVEAVEGVGPYHAGLHGGDHLEDAAALLGPHAG